MKAQLVENRKYGVTFEVSIVFGFVFDDAAEAADVELMRRAEE